MFSSLSYLFIDSIIVFGIIQITAKMNCMDVVCHWYNRMGLSQYIKEISSTYSNDILIQYFSNK